MRYMMKKASLYTSDIQGAIVQEYGDTVIRHIAAHLEPGDVFNTKTICNAPGMMHLQETTRRMYIGLILENYQELFKDYSGIVLRVSRMQWKVLGHKHYNLVPKTSPEIFYDSLGRPPKIWEHHMINCPDMGFIGHLACGWCGFHKQPNYVCGCHLTPRHQETNHENDS